MKNRTKNNVPPNCPFNQKTAFTLAMGHGPSKPTLQSNFGFWPANERKKNELHV
jgi:hypothetical protein